MKLFDIHTHRLIGSSACLLTLLSLPLLSSSCEKIDNGDLEGMWVISRVDRLETGVSGNVRTMLRSWSFQGHLAKMHNFKEEPDTTMIMSRFAHEGDQLIISSPFVYNRMSGDIFLDMENDAEQLTTHYINFLPDTFQIETLNRKKMQIVDEKLRIYFDKY